MFFYYEWWQTFGFDNLAYKMVWTSLTLGSILFCFHIFVGKRASNEATANKRPDTKPQVPDLGITGLAGFNIKDGLKGSANG